MPILSSEDNRFHIDMDTGREMSEEVAIDGEHVSAVA